MRLLRQYMTSLHTWTGLLFGWLLYFVFVTGTAGYFDTEIDRWMTPELPAFVAAEDPVPAFDIAINHLQEHGAGADYWFTRIPRDRNYSPYTFVQWTGDNSGSAELDPLTGEVLSGARATRGGQQLYQMHYVLHYMPENIGQWIVGLATMFMLVALITGIIVHKRIFIDFFTFRPGKRQRSWLDAHNISSVITLPYQLMITYSGLLFLMTFYMPFVVSAHYGFDDQGRPDERTMSYEMEPVRALYETVEPAGRAAPLTDIAPLLEQAQQHWGQGALRFIQVYHPGDANARVVIADNIGENPVRSLRRLVFDGVSGELLEETGKVRSGPEAFYDIMTGLHEALFAGPLLRWLFFFSGILGCAMVATGLVLWTVKRRQRLEAGRQVALPGLRAVEKLNMATIVGFPVAVAAYFWANRLLPVDMAGRADWEINILFLTWAAMAVHAVLRPAHRAWTEQTGIAALAFIMIPLLNGFTTERGLLHSIRVDDWVFAGFDLTMAVLGLLAGLAWRILRKREAGPLPRTISTPDRAVTTGQGSS